MKNVEVRGRGVGWSDPGQRELSGDHAPTRWFEREIEEPRVKTREREQCHVSIVATGRGDLANKAGPARDLVQLPRVAQLLQHEHVGIEAPHDGDHPRQVAIVQTIVPARRVKLADVPGDHAQPPGRDQDTAPSAGRARRRSRTIDAAASMSTSLGVEDRMNDCLFCKIRDGVISANKVADTADAIAFRDINPQAPTHILIVPKRHIATLNDLAPGDAELVGRLHLLARELAQKEGIAESGYRVLFNTNRGAGQTVWHIHLHLLGGRSMAWPPG
jgi:histidine triad (HIT) family protein